MMNNQVKRKPMQRYREGIDPSPGYLRDLLDKTGMSQRQFAANVGVNQRTVRNYFSGKFACPPNVLSRLETLAGIQ